MKKVLAIIFLCVLLVLPSFCYGAMAQESIESTSFSIEYNGNATEYVSYMENGIFYVPMRKVCKMLGGEVFYRNRDCSVLVLSRDGDTITHIVGSNVLTVNGKELTFDYPSVIRNNETYISTHMLLASFAPDGIYYDSGKLIIEKQILNLGYHPSIAVVLASCRIDGFYPEKFQDYLDYYRKKPSLDIEDVVFKVNLGLDAPFYEDIVVSGNPHDLLVLVNKYNKLPDNFAADNLVNMDRKYTLSDNKQYLLSSETYEKYAEMSDYASGQGLSLKVVSAYRTEDYQKGLYNNSVRKNGKVYADNYSAKAGHSEHQTGLAVDINSTKGVFAYTPEFKWLKDHAHEYGFILRYPKGKEWITGYAYEPWHYRYVGTEAAKRIYEEGITYEEYYVKYIAPTEYK